MFNLKGKVALVTGGAAGIGLGIARGLARAGASIAIVDRNSSNSDMLQELKSKKFHPLVLTADVTDRTQVKAMVDATARQFGRIDILVNNAGINIGGSPEELSAENWLNVIDVNLNAPFFCAQEAYPYLKQRGGKVINIGSILSNLATPSGAAYAASKAGLLNLTRSLGIAWASENIQVNAILPGWIDTGMTQTARDKLPDLNDRILGRVPAKRWGRPIDLAGTAIFLASAASDFITCTGVVVDGGYSAVG